MKAPPDLVWEGLLLCGHAFFALKQNLTAMKNERMPTNPKIPSGCTPRRAGRVDANMPRPENKDNLDSRERKEEGYRPEDDETNKAEKKPKASGHQ